VDSLTSGSIGSGARILNDGDIVVEYHPHSGKTPQFLGSEGFKASLGNRSDPMKPPDDNPWGPFRSREDFEFADIVHDANLNRPQIERLIKFIRRCENTPGSFTIQSYSDLKDSLEHASKLLTPVTTFLPSVPDY
jgi:hypothetical protein